MGRLKSSVPSNVAEMIVVRHGETTWNVSGRLQGQAESDLTENGVRQAQAVADRLGRGAKDVAAVFSSDLKRAVDTAQLIADKCGCHEGGGESLNQLYARTKAAMEEIAQRHLGQRVIVVSHGGVLRTMYIVAEGKMPPGRVQNTSLNVFHISGSREWTLRSWGDVNHLQGVEFLRSAAGGDELA